MLNTYLCAASAHSNKLEICNSYSQTSAVVCII